MKNIELFNLAVGEVLGECYESFPVPAYITKGIIGIAVKEYYPNPNPNHINLDDLEFEISKHTINWLAKADYIWIMESKEGSRAVNATLSPKGLELLNAMPKSVDGSEPIGSQLAKGIKEVGVGAFQALVVQVLSGGVS
jgi:hypothetical protein